MSEGGDRGGLVARRCRAMPRDRSRRAALVVVALVLVAVSAVVAAPAPTEGAPPPTVPTSGRYLEPVFDEVTITRDVPYRETVTSQGEDVTLRLDIYEPAGDTATERPVYLVMSGGYFVLLDKGFLLGAGEAFAQAGYVVVSIEYRVRPEMDMSRFPDEYDEEQLRAAVLDAYDDARAAVDWLTDHAEEYRIDPRAIVAAGGSAGGTNAWNLAWLAGTETRPDPPAIAAAVPLAAAPMPEAVPGPGSPPVLAFHGTADSVIPFAWAQEPCAAATGRGARCELVAYEGAGHPVVQSEIDVVALHGDDIRRRTFQFLAETVLAPLGYFPSTPPSTGPPSPTGPTTSTTVAQPAPRSPVPPPARPVRRTPNFTG